MSKQPRVGTISHATLRTDHLIEAFYNELIQYEDDKQPKYSLSEHALLQRVLNGEYDDLTVREADLANFILIDMEGALENLAPEGLYFGTCEGDGSDFGFWHVRAETSPEYLPGDVVHDMRGGATSDYEWGEDA